MQTLSGDKISLLSRLYAKNGVDRLAVSVLSAFSFAGGESAYLPEAEIWSLAAPIMKDGIALEEGFAKPGKEFFVSGSAYAPPGAQVKAVKAQVNLADIEHSLYVVGDRTWRAGEISDPQPFSAMPVDWRHAFGGKLDPRNPLGVGFDKDPAAGTLAVPNVVASGQVSRFPDQDVRPVSFLPQGSAWPRHSGQPVSADADWLQGKKEGLPEDFDYSWFQTAPLEQQGKGRFQPGDAFVVSHMHPQKEQVQGTLPYEQPWALVERHTGQGLKAEPVALGLDTVWLFPDQEKGVLVWHGETAALDDEGSDILALRADFGDKPEQFANEIIPLAAPPPPPPAAKPPALPVPENRLSLRNSLLLPDRRQTCLRRRPLLEQRQSNRFLWLSASKKQLLIFAPKPTACWMK